MVDLGPTARLILGHRAGHGEKKWHGSILGNSFAGFTMLLKS